MSIKGLYRTLYELSRASIYDLIRLRSDIIDDMVEHGLGELSHEARELKKVEAEITNRTIALVERCDEAHRTFNEEERVCKAVDKFMDWA